MFFRTPRKRGQAQVSQRMFKMLLLFLVSLAIVVGLHKVFYVWSQKISYSYDWAQQFWALLASGFILILMFDRWVLPAFSQQTFRSLAWGDVFRVLFDPSFLAFLVLVVVLTTISLIDYWYYEIPNEYNALVFALGLAWAFSRSSSWEQAFLASLVLFGLFFVLMVATKGQLGAGDVKLVAGLGLFLGVPGVLPFFMYSFLMAALVSVFLLATKKKKRSDRLPFGPFLVAGFFLAFFG
ncbi:UNVERIFIED_ORG: type IV leader peptidase family protein [Anoxybacillus amylolyticus]